MVDTPRVELRLGDTWTDVSSYVRYEDRVRVERGRRSEGSSDLENSTCEVTLTNTDGRFSPRHPTSPYYGLLGRNTPLRVSLPYGSSYLRVRPAGAGQATCPDSADLDVTGDIDVRIDIDADQWHSGELAARYETTGDERSWWFGVTTGGVPQLIWSPDGTFASRLFATSTAALPVRRGRLAVRATLDVDNGAGGWTVRFYTADTIDGTWVQFGSDVTGTGTTSVHGGTAVLEVGSSSDIAAAPLPGRYLAFQLLDGIGGTLVADPDFSSPTAGAGSFTDTTGNTWTVSSAAVIDDRRWRFHGEVSKWPPTRDISGTDKTVSITAAGVARRIKQGNAGLRSSMYREFANPARAGIVAYWPLEDGEEATRIASSGGGAAPARIEGGPALADYDGWTASDPIPVMDDGAIIATVPPYTPTGQISVRMFVFAPADGVSAETSLLTLRTSGSAARWDLRLTTGGGLITKAFDDDGNPIDDGAFVDFENGALDTEFTNAFAARGFTILDLELSDNGSGGVDWRSLVIDFNNFQTIGATFPQVFFRGTIPGYTVGAARSVAVGREQGLTNVVVGHLAVADDLDAYAATTAAIAAHNGEEPVARMSRLCAEEEIGFTPVTYGIGGTVTMGDQVNRPLLDLLAEAAAVDGGILYETRDQLGFGYRARQSMYNQDAALTLSCVRHELAESLQPVDDDQRTVNDVTAKRIEGSEYRVVQTTGPLSVLPPPDGVGPYDTSVDLSLESDVQLPDQAGWRRHLGTVDEPRFPKVQINLAHPSFDDALRADALAVDVGDRIVITDPSPDLPPDDIEQIVIGYSEELDQFQHTITYVCRPASPWRVGVVERDGYGRVDTGGSELAEAAGSGDTELLVATTAGPSWTLRGDAVPMDLMVAGERVTVTTVGELLNAASNPYIDGDVTGYVANNGAVAFSTAVDRPDTAPAGGTALFTPDGASVTGGIGNPLTPVGSITPATQYTVSSWVYSPGGWSNHRVHVNWHDSSGTYLSSTFGPATDVPAATWTHLQATLTAPASASQASAWASQGSSPSGTDEWHAWAVKLVDTAAVADHFDRTESNGWGTEPDGRAWTTYGTDSDFSVAAGLADMAIASPGTAYVAGLALDSPGSDFEVTFDAAAAPITGDPLYTYLIGGFDQAAFSWYALRIAMWGDDTVRILLEKRAASGVTSALTGERIVPNVTVHSATTYHARMRVVGGSIVAKVWRSAIDEPAGWQIAAHDTSLTGRDIGVQAWVPPGNTNGAVTFQFGEVWVHTPQRMEVTRSVNGVVKAQSAGAPVSIAEPVYVAL